MSNKKTLEDIKGSEAHRGNVIRREAPIPFKPKKTADSDEKRSVKIKVTEDYYESFKLFNGGTIEEYCRFFQQVDGLFVKQKLRETSDEHQEAYNDAHELLKAHLELKPNEKEGKEDDEDSDSSSDESSDSDPEESSEQEPDPKKKAKPAVKISKLARWRLRRKKLQKQMAASLSLINKQAEKAFRQQEGLFSVEQRNTVQRITREVCWQPYEDEDGDLVKDPRGLSWEAFRMVRNEYMLTVCKKDAAEQQRYYLMWTVHKPWGMAYRTFQNRMLTVNSCIAELPCLKDSDMATDATERMNIAISEHDMANLLLRACQPEWEAQWALVHQFLPDSLRGFLGKMEAIEQVVETQAIPRRSRPSITNGDESKKGTSSKNSNKGSKGGSSKREGGKQKHCQLCQEHGGASHTHNTKDCRRYTQGGKPQPSFGAGGGAKGSYSGKPKGSSDKYNKRNYMVLKDELKKAKKSAKKARRESRKSRGRSRNKNAYSSDSSSGSESDY